MGAEGAGNYACQFSKVQLNHVKYDCCVESHYYVAIEHQFIIVLKKNFVHFVLNRSPLIVELKFSFKIQQTCGIMQGGFARIARFLQSKY